AGFFLHTLGKKTGNRRLPEMLERFLQLVNRFSREIHRSLASARGIKIHDVFYRHNKESARAAMARERLSGLCPLGWRAPCAKAQRSRLARAALRPSSFPFRWHRSRAPQQSDS